MKASTPSFVRTAAVVALAGLVSTAAADQTDRAWKMLYEKDGVLVSTRDEPGRDLPSMRGQTTLRANARHLLDILLDDAHSTEWAKGADETRVLRKIDSRTELIYAHSRQPWPVRDRDLVMRRTVDVLEEGQAYRVHLVCVPGEQATRPNVVRVKECETTFDLRAVDASHTKVDYQVQADPGGHIPDWIVRSASRSIPADTLRALAKQVTLTRARYARAPEEWAAAD